MSGYSNYSMSNNAVEAYAEGRVPASKTGVPAELVRRFCAGDRQEFHHTSKKYNVTLFFDRAEVRAIFGLEKSEDVEPNPQAVAALAAFRADRRAKKTQVYLDQEVRWLEWNEGVGGWNSARRMIARGARVEVSGQTATIHVPEGSICHLTASNTEVAENNREMTFRKRLTTNGFSFRASVRP